MTVRAEPQSRVYRYTVRCDRERFHDIEKMARSVGVSADQLVQLHFEGILDSEQLARAEKPQTVPVSREEVETATRHGMTPGALRVYRAVATAADENGRAEIGVGTIARAAGLTEGSVRVLLTKLTRVGRLRRLSAGGFRRTTVYRVKPLDGEAEA